MATPMIVRQILAAIACLGLAAAAAAHLMGNEPAAELIGNAAFASLGLAALMPAATAKRR
jgi:hypothetical protein